jgi:hypothetical protein
MRSYVKNILQQKDWGIAQVVGHLTDKYEAQRDRLGGTEGRSANLGAWSRTKSELDILAQSSTVLGHLQSVLVAM